MLTARTDGFKAGNGAESPSIPYPYPYPYPYLKCWNVKKFKAWSGISSVWGCVMICSIHGKGIWAKKFHKSELPAHEGKISRTSGVFFYMFESFALGVAVNASSNYVDVLGGLSLFTLKAEICLALVELLN